jgi:hypothetical protein
MSAQKKQTRRAQVDTAENFLGKFCRSCCEKDEEVKVFKGVEVQILYYEPPRTSLQKASGGDSNCTTHFDTTWPG